MFKWLAAIVLLLALRTACADFSGTVVSVIDGDTVDVLVKRKPVRVRLAQIDAPEMRQPYGAWSRKTLGARVSGKLVTVRETGVDRYGRVLGIVFVDGENINRAMVALGAAWVYRSYPHDRTLLDVEARARTGRLGLWAGKQPIPPWKWRKKQAGGKRAATRWTLWWR